MFLRTLQNLRREELIDTKELKLDGIAAGSGGGIDEMETACQIAGVVTGDLGDE